MLWRKQGWEVLLLLLLLVLVLLPLTALGGRRMGMKTLPWWTWVQRGRCCCWWQMQSRWGRLVCKHRGYSIACMQGGGKGSSGEPGV
jgi:hypothetical protein